MRYETPHRLGYVIDESASTVYLMLLPDGDPQILTGTAYSIWRAAASGADPVTAMIETFADDAAEVVRSETTAFLDRLVASGYLREKV